MNHWLGLLASSAACAALGGCAAPDPDEELRALVENAEAAAEARNTGFFRELVAESYVDAGGRRREDVVDLIRGYFFVNAVVEVVNRIESVELVGEDAATVTLQTAVLGRGQGASVLATDAHLYRIELELVRDGGDWRVIGAQWERMLR